MLKLDEKCKQVTEIVHNKFEKLFESSHYRGKVMIMKISDGVTGFFINKYLLPRYQLLKGLFVCDQT